MEKEGKKEGFVKAPRNIVQAQDLTSTEKILLLLLIDKYRILRKYDRLQPDRSFYITGAELEACMDIKRAQILKKHIPALEKKGFISKISRPEDKAGVLKTYCYIKLNAAKIVNHQGDQKDAEVQAKRAAKAVKMKQAMGKTPVLDSPITTADASIITDPQQPKEETTNITEPAQPTQTTSTMPQQEQTGYDNMFLGEDEEERTERIIQNHLRMSDAETQWEDLIQY